LPVGSGTTTIANSDNDLFFGTIYMGVLKKPISGNSLDSLVSGIPLITSSSGRPRVHANTDVLEYINDTLYAGFSNSSLYWYSPVPVQTKPYKPTKSFSGFLRYRIINRQIIVEYELQTANAPLDIGLFNLRGERVTTIRKYQNNRGNNTSSLSIKDVSPGFYVLKAMQNGFSQNIKIMMPR
jgi:hypothetical protein